MIPPFPMEYLWLPNSRENLIYVTLIVIVMVISVNFNSTNCHLTLRPMESTRLTSIPVECLATFCHQNIILDTEGDGLKINKVMQSL